MNSGAQVDEFSFFTISSYCICIYKCKSTGRRRLGCAFCERRRKASSRHLQRDRNFIVEPRCEGRSTVTQFKPREPNCIIQLVPPWSVGRRREDTCGAEGRGLPASSRHSLCLNSRVNAGILFLCLFIYFNQILKCSEP